MKSGFLVLSIISTLTACAPRDVPADSASKALSLGDTVSTTSNGQRLATCPESSDDWSDISVFDKYEQVVAGAYNTLVVTGYMNCLRVGSVVDVKSGSNRTGPSIGRAKIIALEVKQADQVRSTDLHGKVAQSDFSYTMNGVKTRLQPKHQNLVTLIHIEYVKGSAPNEKLLLEKAATAADPFSNLTPDLKQRLLSGEIIELTTPGQKSPFCDENKNGFPDMRIQSEEVAAFQSGDLQAVFQTSPFLCNKVGEQLPASNSKTKEIVGQLEILKIYVGKLGKFTPQMFADHYTQTNLAATVQRLTSIVAKNAENQNVIVVAVIRNLAFPANTASTANPATPVQTTSQQTTSTPTTSVPPATPAAPTPPADPFATVDPAIKQKLLNGEKVEITAVGQKSPFCDPNRPGWKDIKIQDEDAAAFQAGELKTVFVTSPVFCANVGETLKAVNSKTSAELGSVQVQGIILIKLSQITVDLIPDNYTKTKLPQIVERLNGKLKSGYEGVVALGIIQKIDTPPTAAAAQ